MKITTRNGLVTAEFPYRELSNLEIRLLEMFGRWDIDFENDTIKVSFSSLLAMPADNTVIIGSRSSGPKVVISEYSIKIYPFTNSTTPFTPSMTSTIITNRKREKRS